MGNVLSHVKKDKKIKLHTTTFLAYLSCSNRQKNKNNKWFINSIKSIIHLYFVHQNMYIIHIMCIIHTTTFFTYLFCSRAYLSCSKTYLSCSNRNRKPLYFKAFRDHILPYIFNIFNVVQYGNFDNCQLL